MTKPGRALAYALSLTPLALATIALLGCAPKPATAINPKDAQTALNGQGDAKTAGATTPEPTLRAQAGVPDPLADAKDAASPATAVAQAQIDRDRADNVLANQLALSLETHPNWLSRQAALCGPHNATSAARVQMSLRPLPDDVDSLRVACIAKDIAQRKLGLDAALGVKNTNSL